MMMSSTPTLLLLVAVAPFVGSFLGVLADRLPRDEDIVRARSTCRNCNIVLGVRDLVPLVSFAVTRGRCRTCRAAIPAWLFWIEVLATALALLAVGLWSDPVLAWGAAVLWWILLALVACDLGHFRLPDVLTASLLIWAMGLSLLGVGPSVLSAILGAAIGAGSFALLRWAYARVRKREGLGLGDVKLMAGLGALVGPFDVPLMVLWAALAGLAVAFAGALTGRTTSRADSAVPFGAALAAAGGLLWAIRQIPV